MITRRAVLKLAGTTFVGISAGASPFEILHAQNKYPSVRPKLKDRKFVSDAVESKVLSVKRDITDEELSWLFENCYPNTLDTTVESGTREGKPDTFVITGDIHAMWLRDSSAQVWPYLPLTKEDKKLQQLIKGVIHRQSYCITIDPYANAFNKNREGSYWEKDLTEMKKELHERKWEIDSLCYPVRLAYGYWITTGDESIFDAEWRSAASSVVRTFREQQRKNGKGPYNFQRETAVASDTVPMGGYGNPTRKIGLIHSMFRPSDDACLFPFLIPSNYFALTSLHQLAEIHRRVTGDTVQERECSAFAEELSAALERHAFIDDKTHGKLFAYEVDGFGNTVFMDDANVPSIMAMPYLGACSLNDSIYQNTRKHLLSDANPFFFAGSAADGIGGPHVGMDMIWPMGITMRALTSSEDAEIRHCLKMLKRTHDGTGFMHESFHKDDPAHFTRKWFAWANTLFGELIVKLAEERPLILKEIF
ncbi:MAG: glycoside hydrolase family 125 protein [Bacteroidetes bacterium]|nr:glycoside hydrolase family 125 protein [Bacteroidota bacterium]